MKRFLLPLIIVAGATTVVNAQNQRFSLIEEFSGENCGPCASKNPAFWSKISAPGNESKVILIKYQSPIPSAGPIYLENTVFTDARMSYYSVPFAPYARLNGSNIGSDGDIANLTQAMIDAGYADLTPFQVTVSNPTYDAAANNTFTVTVTVTASTATTVANGKIRLALAEHLEFTEAPGSNGETEFHNVVRQMYPSADGLTLDASWTAGQTRTYTFTGQIPHYVNPTASERFFVAWLQNETDKKVLQTGKTGNVTITIPSSGIAANSVTLGDEGLKCGLPTSISSHQVELKNTGTAPLTTAKIYYRAGTTGSWTEYNWTGDLAPNATTTVTMPEVTVTTSGNVAIYDSVALPNGNVDVNSYDNVGAGSITVLNETARPLPISHGFETVDNDFVPYASGGFGLPFYNYSGTGIGYDGSNSFLYVPLYQYISGVNGFHILPKPDLSSTGPKALDFYVAYAQISNEEDQLEVVYTTNCGDTWTSIWNKKGNTLKTVEPENRDVFIPRNNSAWRKESVDISSVPAGAYIAFYYIGDNGNGLFVDDITIRNGVPSSIDQLFTNATFELFPNPATDVLNIKFDITSTLKSTVRIFNAAGQMVYTKDHDFAQGTNHISVNTSSLPAGNYIVMIQAEDGSIQNKFTKQ